MRNCSNCGRPTLRTQDWACQWCGFPLLSKAYGKIDKTYREIKEERLRESGISSNERIVEREIEPEPEIAEDLREEMPPAQVTENETKSESEEVTGEDIEPVAEKPGVQEKQVPVKEEITVPDVIPLPGPAGENEVKPPILLPEGGVTESESVPVSEAEPEKKEEESEPVPESEEEADNKAVPEEKSEGMMAADLGNISSDTPISVEELNSIFASEKAEANVKLKDRTLQVSGVVDKIFLRESLGILYCILAGAGKRGTWKVRCTFDAEHSSMLRKLAEGQKVIVQGEYNGCERNILLKQCIVIG